MDGDDLTVTDTQGNVATVTQADVMQSNGAVRVIDAARMPAN
ncbi:fasciclin domain-containing protein [Aureimonas mangrovi]|nr:fasciclin domain-containing protein [Aureimonas mangrovi]